MKKILYTIVGAGLLFANIGCADKFERKPSTSLTNEKAIVDEESLQLAVFGVYEMFTVERGGYASDFLLYADCTGGDATTGYNYGQISPLYSFGVDYTHNITGSMYDALYKPIAFANMAIEAAAKLEQTAQVKRLTGELIAARAILHFDAARVYAQLPTVNGVNMDAANSGVAIVTKTYPRPVDAKFKRSTLTDTYKFVVDELKSALTMLDTSAGKAKKLGGINYWTVESALARAYLYLGDWANAYAAATDVIAGSGYTLFTHDNYLTEWVKEGSSEFITEFTTSSATTLNTAQWNSLGSYTYPSGYFEVVASSAFSDLVQALDDNDIRKKSLVDYDGAFGTIKYLGKTGATNRIYENNPKIFRLAEIYYIAAEAALKNSDNTNALKYYNDLRRSRYAAGTYTDATALTLSDILEDRRVELFCEGHRMWDLKRNNLPIPDHSDATKTKQANDNLLLLPIPLRELDISTEMVQNPGYGDGR
jgi:hypothetical protein